MNSYYVISNYEIIMYPSPVYEIIMYPSPVYCSLTPILLKIAIFEILPNFEPIVSSEDLEIAKKPEDMLKSIVLAS